MDDRDDQGSQQDTQEDAQQDEAQHDGAEEAKGGGDEAQEADVQGVDTSPDDDKKSIAVDTDERLEGRDDAKDFDDIPEEELEKERDERLAPENRPDNVEIDNSKRDFNPETGLFEDTEVEEPPEGAPFATTEAEQSNSGDSDSSDADGDDSDSKDSGDMDPMDAADDDTADAKDRTEATDAEQSKEAKESKNTES